MHFQIKNPILQDDWNSVLYTAYESSFFHTSAWAAVLVKAYRYRPVYITYCKCNRLAALLPVMEINSILTGKRGVSLPFTDACPPFSENEEQLKELIEYALQYSIEHRWRSLEFRTDRSLQLPALPSRQYVRHCLDLEDSSRELESKVRKSTRRNIKRALRSGVRVSVSQKTQSVRDFYKLNCLTRKRHGLPPQPWYFFRAVHEQIISRGMGHVFIAYLHGEPIAGSIFFHYHHRAYYKYGASNLNYQQYRANNLVMWKALQYYRTLGCREVDFGRTEKTHTGLLQFKRGWGANEDHLNYYLFNARRRAFVTEAQDAPPGYLLFKRLPISILRIIGHFLYRHVG